MSHFADHLYAPLSHILPHLPSLNNHSKRASDVRYLRPSHITIQQPSIPALHTVPTTVDTLIHPRFQLVEIHRLPTSTCASVQRSSHPPQSTNIFHLPTTLAAKSPCPSHTAPHPCALHIAIPRFLIVVQQQHRPFHNLVPPTTAATSLRLFRVVPH